MPDRCTTAPSSRSNASEVFTILRYQLDNGLDVILVPDRRAQTVAVEIGYKVGSAHEPPGRAGFAHLFEHLMFTGTPAYPDVDAAYGAVGVDVNAATWEDNTLFHARGLASALPLILSIEADRMANQGRAIRARDLEVQRGVVLNEIRENVLDAVNGTAWQMLPALLYPQGHPYSRAIYGSIADLEAATIRDVHAFFDAYYLPNNAILTIVGDIDLGQTREWIGDTFGRVARGRDVPALEPWVVQPARGRLDLDDRVPSPTLFFAWTTPSIRERDTGLLRVASELVGNVEYGVLRQALVDTGIATGIGVWPVHALLGSHVVAQVTLAEGVTLGAAEAAITAALDRFIGSPLDRRDFERARLRILRDDRVTNDDPGQFAENIVAFTQFMDDPEIAAEDDRFVVEATPDSVVDAARRWLSPADASIIRVSPGERASLPDVLTASTGQSAALGVPSRRQTVIPSLAAGKPAPPHLPVSETVRLSNGVRLVHYRQPRASMVYLAAHSPAGSLAAPAGREGIVQLAAGMGVRGAGDRDAAAFGRAAKDVGADINAEVATLASFLTLSVPPETLRPASALFADALRRPRFDEAEWEIARAETLHDLVLRESDIADVAGRYAEARLFPRAPGMPAIDRSIASVQSIGREDARAIYRRIFTPHTLTIHSVGDLAIADLQAILEQGLGDWRPESEPLFTPPPEATTFHHGRRAIVVPDASTEQTALLVALPAPGTTEQGYVETVAVLRAVATDFISRVNRVVREDLALTYGTDGEIYDDVAAGSAMTVETPVAREATGMALKEIISILERLADDPIRDDELERTVVAYRTAMAGTAQTTLGLFEEVWRPLGRGSSLEAEHKRRLAVAGLDLGRVRDAARRIASLERMLIVAVGDPGVVVPQLEQLGLSPEVVERTL